MTQIPTGTQTLPFRFEQVTHQLPRTRESQASPLGRRPWDHLGPEPLLTIFDLGPGNDLVLLN